MHSQALYDAHLQLPAALESPRDFRPLYEDLKSAEKDQVEIHIKKQGRMSNWLDSIELKADEFEIRGPFVPELASE